MAKTLSFLLLIVLISSLQIQARESNFFHKFTFITTKKQDIPESQISQAPTTAPTLAPAPVPAPESVPIIAAEPAPEPAEAPAQFYADSGSGYGLYGRDSDQFPPTKESVTSATNENELLNEELSAENYETGYQNKHGYNGNGYATEKQGMSDTRFMQKQKYQGSYYNNNKYKTNNNNYNNAYASNYRSNGYTSNRGYTGNDYKINGYENEKQGMSDTRFMQKQNYQGSYYNNNEYKTNNNNYNNAYASNYRSNGYTSNTGYTGNNYKTNGYENEKQGMSDTRFLENGKYYYDIKNENNYYANGFESERGTTTTNEGYYGNRHNVNEFNTMEEFENQQENQESPEEYVP